MNFHERNFRLDHAAPASPAQGARGPAPRHSRRAKVIGIGVPAVTLLLIAAYLVFWYFNLCAPCNERPVPIPCGGCTDHRPPPPHPAA